MIEFREASLADARAYWGRDPEITFRGLVAEDERGDLVGIGGTYWCEGRLILFSEMKPGMRKYRKARARAVRMLLDFAERQSPVCYAVADPNESTSEKLLAKVGFVPTGIQTEAGELLVRRVQ